MKATPVVLLKSRQWNNGNLTSISMTPNKVNGLDFPSKIRQSRFSSYKDIEGMDPLQVPLWKFLYQGLHNTWLRRVAYGRETFVLPFDNIGTTVFVAELVSQLRTRNVDLDKLATFRSRSAGQCAEPKGGYPKHGQRGCSAASILASSSTVRGRLPVNNAFLN